MNLEHAVYVCRNLKHLTKDSVCSTRFTYDPEEFAINRFMTDGIKFAAIARDGFPVGIGGLQLTSPKVWFAWMCGTDRWNECASEAVWKARYVVKLMMADKDSCHRIQAMCISDEPVARKYLELVGFKWECDLIKMCKDGRSMSSYIIV